MRFYSWTTKPALPFQLPNSGTEPRIPESGSQQFTPSPQKNLPLYLVCFFHVKFRRKTLGLTNSLRYTNTQTQTPEQNSKSNNNNNQNNEELNSKANILFIVNMHLDLFYFLRIITVKLLLLSFLSPSCRVFTIIYPKKQCWYGLQRCSCSVFTIFATCNVISSVKYVLYFYVNTFRNMFAVPNMTDFFFWQCLNFVLSWQSFSGTEESWSIYKSYQ
jgi:hypothetical protein